MDGTQDGGRSVTNGRFFSGNQFSVGNPHAVKVGKLRSALLNAVTEDDLKIVVGKLIERAREGDIAATKLLLDRTCGKSFVDRLPNPKPPASGFPTHDDGTPLTLEERKAFLRERIMRLLGDAGQTERMEAERDVDGDTGESGSLTTSTAAGVG